MPFTGGYTPNPERYGGGKPLLKYIVESLSNGLGSAYDPSSKIFPELMAYSRALWGNGWSANARMANQWDPLRMTDFLSRWEGIFGIYASPTDTETVRRARVQASMQRIGAASNFAGINDTLTTLLGSSIYLGIPNLTSGSANVWTPTSWPFGTHDSTGAIDWYSTVAYLPIKVAKPANMSYGDFYAKVGSVMPELDIRLPAWVTFDWYREDVHGGLGFYLDEIPNLDNEAFD